MPVPDFFLLDAHAHLDHYTDAEISEVVSQTVGNTTLTISNSMDVPSYVRNLEIARNSRFILPTFGIHPWQAHEYSEQLESLNPYIQNSPMLGEIGLDFHFVTDKSLFPAQRMVFEYLLQAAKEQNKIVSLHTKGAEREVLALLQKYEIQRAIIHWYSGPPGILRQLIRWGYYFTIGVEVQFSSRIQTIANEVPIHLLLTETDNPGGLKWLIDKNGMPVDLLNVIEQVAVIKQVAVAKLIELVHDNFLRLVADDSWLAETAPILYQKRKKRQK